MAFKVFLSYGSSAEDQAFAMRLQVLAATHGLRVDLPERGWRMLGEGPRPHPEIQKLVKHADCVLAIIIAESGPAVGEELAYAAAKHKLVIPIIQSGLQGRFFPESISPVFVFSPSEGPEKLEHEILEYVSSQKISKGTRRYITALVALCAGLLLFNSLPDRAGQ